MYLPERVYIKPQSRDDPTTTEIVRRVHALDAKIPIVHMRDHSVPFPSRSTTVWRWRQRKKLLILACRTTPFLTTFASPGKVVEDMGVLLNLTWQCPSDCNFCYLQNVLPPDHMIYTNLEKLDAEVAVEPYVHRSVLSLWTIISFALRQELPRIPADFHKAADYIRARFQKEGVSTEAEATQLLEELLRARSAVLYKILSGEGLKEQKVKGHAKSVKKPCKLGFSAKDLKISRSLISKYYKENSQFPIRLNASELTDLIAYDPLCGYSNRLLALVARHPEIEINLRSKSTYVDEMISHDGCNRVRFAMNFNTPYVIEHYENGTASLEDRLAAARRVQDAKGFRLKIVIEPVIKYPGYERDYVDLACRIMRAVDTNRLEDIAVGFVRYSGRLQARVMRNFPKTDLLDDRHGLLPLVKGDRRRYPLDERTRLYGMVLDEFRKHSKAYLRLADETPETWDGLGLDRAAHIQRSVYQYPG